MEEKMCCARTWLPRSERSPATSFRDLDPDDFHSAILSKPIDLAGRVSRRAGSRGAPTERRSIPGSAATGSKSLRTGPPTSNDHARLWLDPLKPAGPLSEHHPDPMLAIVIGQRD